MLNSNNDILFTQDDSIFNFKYLDWDSQFFARPCYFLDLETSKLESSRVKINSLSERLRNTFISVKIDSSASKELSVLLHDLGFYYIDTEVGLLFTKISNLFPETDTDVQIINQKVNIDLPYEALGRACRCTRFHFDVNIPKEKADLLWINRIRNFKITSSDYMFLALNDEKVCGAILAKENTYEKKVTLIFVSVIDNFRYMNIGSILMQHVTNHFANLKIETSTQIRNLVGLNYYIKNGFQKVPYTKSVFHRWG